MSDEIKTQHGAIGLLMAECEQLRRDLAQANADNARLKEENKNLSVEGATICYQCGTLNPAKELRDLITPTIELFQQLTYPAISALNNELVHQELDRLRSLLTSNSKSDTNTP